MSEQGTFGNGSLAVSSYVFDEQQSANASTSDSGSWVETLSGTNQSLSYSGNDTGNFADSYKVNSAGTLNEQGSYGNGSFALSQVSYSDSGSDTVSSSQSDSSSWTGGYSGTDDSSGSSSGNGSWSLSLLGSYSGGSWSLSSDVLQGGSSDSYGNSQSEEDCLATSNSCLSEGLIWNYSHGASGAETDTLYQSGVETAGVYSNSSYNESLQESDLTTSSLSDNMGTGGQSSDTWTDSHTLSVTGVGMSGSESESSAATYSWQGNGGGGSDSGIGSGSISDGASGSSAGSHVLQGSGGGSGIGTNAWQTVVSVSLPAGAVPPSPDGTSVPENGAEDLGGMAPVSAMPGLSLVGATSAWMALHDQLGAASSNRGVYFASGNAPFLGGAVKPLGLPGGLMAADGNGEQAGRAEQGSQAGPSAEQVAAAVAASMAGQVAASSASGSAPEDNALSSLLQELADGWALQAASDIRSVRDQLRSLHDAVDQWVEEEAKQQDKNLGIDNARRTEVGKQFLQLFSGLRPYWMQVDMGYKLVDGAMALVEQEATIKGQVLKGDLEGAGKGGGAFGLGAIEKSSLGEIPTTMERWKANLLGFVLEQWTGEEISDEQLAYMEQMLPGWSDARNGQAKLHDIADAIDPESAQRGRDAAPFVEAVILTAASEIAGELGIFRAAEGAEEAVAAGERAPSQVAAPKTEYMPSAEARTRGVPNKGTARYKQLVNKENRLANELAAGGNRGVAGTVNTAEANFLGERFVGEGFTERVGPHGERILISKDGLRQYRSPTSKLSEHATTGRQANFQSRSVAEGAWENNVHFNIED